LHFNVESDAGNLSVTVPAFRVDLDGKQDLAEEIARVFGYANIPNTTPWSHITEGMMSIEKEAIDYKNIGKFLEVKLVEDEKDRKIQKFLKFLEENN